jgi:hypothetical protein
MPYVVNHHSAPALGARELVGWPASLHGLAEPSAFNVIDGFAFDKSDLGPPQHTKIIAVARHIMANAIRAVRLLGHTDPVGTPTYNIGLGQRRADAVKRALLATLDRMRPGSAASVSVTTDSAGETQPLPGQPAARNRRVDVFIPGRPSPPPGPQPAPSQPAQTQTVKIVMKSSILRVGSAVGSVPCSVTLAPVPIGGLPAVPVPSGVALRAFGAMLDRVVSDHIRSDVKDRMYRLYSQQNLQVVCKDNNIISVTPTPVDTDVGQECIVPGRACLTPPPLIITGLTLRRTAADTFAFGWMGEGCPHGLAEPAFQAICRRTSRFIWHNVSGTIRCGATGVSVGVTLTGSRFPTHAVFVNGALRASIPQGMLGMLWDPHPANPNRVR